MAWKRSSVGSRPGPPISQQLRHALVRSLLVCNGVWGVTCRFSTVHERLTGARLYGCETTDARYNCSMYSEVHENRVLYKSTAQPGNLYRQIVVVEKEQFQVRVFEGEVVQTDPKFIAECSDAEVYFHTTLRAALDDVENEFRKSVAAGWTPYVPAMP